MIYLDNNATTPVCLEAREAMMPFLTECWANPGSGYRFAKQAKEAVALAREQVAKMIGAESEEIVFTSCGTESSNAAIYSAINYFPERRHLITCATEHEATLRPLEALQEKGWELTVLGVDSQGQLDLAALESAIRPETALISLMWANNETGVIQPITEAASLANKHGILLHTDAVQAAGKTALQFSDLPVHYASLSGHKFHAPKGVGVLYVKKTAPFIPQMLGGGQENGRRSGTLNVPYLAAIGAAAQAAQRHLETEANAVAQLRDAFEARLQQEITGVTIHGLEAPRLGNTSNFRIEGADAQGMILLLDQKGVCVSSGSACATGSIKPSHVLTAMGLTSRQARETLRFSLSRNTTQAEIEQTLIAIRECAQKLQITRK